MKSGERLLKIKFMSRYFLAKTDPDTFSIEDFAKEKVTRWNGVHNYAAINCIKQWKVGDYVIIYHSITNSRLVGLATVVTNPIKDDEDLRGISWVANLELIESFAPEKQITLKDIKRTNLFNDFALVRQSRLSVMECTKFFVAWLKTKNILE
jgi:predicted RNA-binding protein with PUA-like domain